MSKSRRDAVHMGIEQQRPAFALNCGDQITHRIYLCRIAKRAQLLFQVAANMFFVP